MAGEVVPHDCVYRTEVGTVPAWLRPEFTQALVEHMHEAKRLAILDLTATEKQHASILQRLVKRT